MHLITPCNLIILQTLRFRLEKLKSSMFWTGSKYSLSPGTLQLIRRRVNNIPTSSVTDAWIRHNEVVSRPPPLFASSSTSPHLAWPDSFTCVWFFNFLFLFCHVFALFELAVWLIFCCFTFQSHFLLSCCDHQPYFQHLRSCLSTFSFRQHEIGFLKIILS